MFDINNWLSSNRIKDITFDYISENVDIDEMLEDMVINVLGDHGAEIEEMVGEVIYNHKEEIEEAILDEVLTAVEEYFR